MPRKGMRSICFNPKTPSFSYLSHQPSPSRAASLYSMPSTPPRLRNFSESMVDKTIEGASTLIMKWNPDSSTYASVTSLFYESKSEAIQFMNHVNELQKVMHLLVNEDSTSEKLVQAQNLMQIAMKRLQKEFYQILSMNRAHLDPESVSTRSSRASARSSTSDYEDYGDGSSLPDDDIRAAGDSITEVEEVSSIAMADLKSIAECMIASGYAIECIQIYKTIRKSIIDEGIYRLGVEKISSSKMKKMDWEVLEIKIKNWLEAVKVSMRTLFNGEKILCDHVFSSSDNIRESCFSDISKEGASLLFGFPELVVKKTTKSKKSSSSSSSPSPETLFRVLDMYTSIAENWQNIQTIFSFESTSMIRSQALNSLVKLSDSARTMIADFEQSIHKDSSKVIVPGGGIHALTFDSMDYLCLLADYSSVLVDILVDWTPPTATLSFPEFYFDTIMGDESPTSTISTRMAWLILVLLCKLDGKAKHYKDVSLSYLFLANNLHHVVSRVRTSNLRYLLGDEWITKHEAKVKQFANSYEKFAWGPVFASLPENPTAVIAPRDVKEWFKRFNVRFEDAYRKQNSSIVSDPKFRDEIKVSIARKVVPVYREFYDTHRLTAGGGDMDRRSVVRFSPEDVGNNLSDLFFGSVSSSSTMSSSTSSRNQRHSRSSH